MKIIICSTFRDFTGTDNDILQYTFLDSVKKQSYQNFVFVTTTFGEKHVKRVLDNYFFGKSVVYDMNLPSGYRFSLSAVVLNGIRVAQEIKEKCIVIWSTCDIQLDLDLFQLIINNYSDGFSGIIHPNINYPNYDALIQKKGVVADLFTGGIDLMFFDSSVLINAKNDIEKYRFYNWGVFEYFLVAISIKYASRRINLVPFSKIKKIMNNRESTEESSNYFDECIALNFPTLKKYIEDNNICNGSVESVMQYRAHKSFTVAKKTPFYRLILFNYKIGVYVSSRCSVFRKYPFLKKIYNLLRNNKIHYFK